jgi:hypothetical protein
MKTAVYAILSVLALVNSLDWAQAQHAHLSSQEKANDHSQYAIFFGYPGGMVFHTAFHGNTTTRFLLLKTALHSKQLREYLLLNENQCEHIKGMRAPARELSGDRNSEPDEQVGDPQYFAFLSEDQLGRLDLLAVRFDGLAALSRKSVVRRLDLSQASRDGISDAIMRVREKAVLPKVRRDFAAELPEDSDYRNCVFTGQITASLNFQILNALDRDEAGRLAAWISDIADSGPSFYDACEEVERMAPLPNGLDELRQYIHSSVDMHHPAP